MFLPIRSLARRLSRLTPGRGWPLGARASSLLVLLQAQPVHAETLTDPAEETPPLPQPTRRLSDAAELDRAVTMYLAGDYEACAAHLSALLGPSADRPFQDPFIRERARLYHATCLLFLDDKEAAREPLRDALKENPLMSAPDSLTFPPPLVSFFLEVRDEMQQLIKREEENQLALLREEAAETRRRSEERRKHLEELERLAAEETVILKNPRWLMSVPFGVGQFQNGNKTLGWTFLVGETLLAATALGSGAILLDQYRQAARQDPERPLRHEDLNSNTRLAYGTMTVASWGFLAVTLAGILEAHLSYVPERTETRERTLPRQAGREEAVAAPRVVPRIDPEQGELGVAFSGHF